ncbi:phytanoyl-CoA dioxygenase family protein [Sphingomonas lenta]|uniref:Phytanoyl-CoA dioxygenase n=1 Tax=Sphingomonas lenta TaxID=1141887 RepID=A0A2A2SER8_9SPHN|nr:phytanoyl-CoA dioxygenase family protein [Sphingomonas lenta]PAX07738.1 phytanoyl-CoA dioxygenase [Sphingomonas lenta]
MNIDLTPDQIERYRRDGFVVLERVLDEAELELWRAQVGEAVDERVTHQNGLNNRFDGADPFYAKVFTQALRLADTHAGVRDLVVDERLGALAGELVGADAMRMWHDQALVKEPYANQTAWHRDTPYWSFHSPDAINFWVALDDATLANGCLWYLPGTHRMGDYRLVKIGSNMGDMFAEYPEMAAIEAVPAPCPAGSIVVHNAMVVHGAGPNMTPRRRRAMTTAYFPDGCTYNGRPDTLPLAYSRTLREGDPLDDDRFLPLVWSRDGRRGVDAMRPVAARVGEGEATLTLPALEALLRSRPAPARALRLDFGEAGAITWGPEGTAPAATLTTDLLTLERVRDGALDPRVAYMAGRLKVEGDEEAVRELRAVYA